MKTSLLATELAGTVNEYGELHLDEPLTDLDEGPVRVIVLRLQEEDDGEREWLHAAATNPAFKSLSEPAEDLYSPTDGKPFHDEG